MITGPGLAERIWTIPNIISLFRLAGSIILVPCAWLGYQNLFLWFFLFLAMTDWADGKLAVLLNQRSVLGSRLDSWADAALFVAVLTGSVIFFTETLQAEIVWIISATATYLLSTIAGCLKFGRWPSYHTLAAKICWLLVIIGVVSLFKEWTLWPIRLALAAITITNIEALLITIISPVWRNDVSSVFHAWKAGNSE